MLDVQVPEEFCGYIRLCKKLCDHQFDCPLQNYQMIKSMGLKNAIYCSGGQKLHIAHARLNKRGIAYKYGDWYCCLRVLAGLDPQFWASSEMELMKKIV